MLYLLFNESTHRLSPNVIQVWCVRLDLKAFTDRAKNFQQLLSDDELGKANLVESDSSRNQFIVNRGILRTILANYLGVKPREVNFKYNRNQKPSLSRSSKSSSSSKSASNTYDIQFNLAHSYGLAIYAFSSRYRLGSDVEWMNRPSIKDASGKYSIAGRFFSQDERDCLSKLRGDTRRREAFFKFWTAKEALLKARGENIGALGSQDTVDFSTVLSGRKGILRGRRSISNKDKQHQLVFSFWQFEPTNHYIATLVREGAFKETKLQMRKLITEKQAEAWTSEFLSKQP